MTSFTRKPLFRPDQTTGTYFVTFNTEKKYPYFEEQLYCELFILHLQLTCQIKEYSILGFCVLGEHVHLIIFKNGKYTVSEFMHSLKRNTSKDINRATQYTDKEYVQRKYKSPNQILDRKIQEVIDEIHLSENVNHDKRFKWQKSFFCKAITSENQFHKAQAYTTFNYLKHEGYSINYKFTSNNYPDLINWDVLI